MYKRVQYCRKYCGQATFGNILSLKSAFLGVLRIFRMKYIFAILRKSKKSYPLESQQNKPVCARC